MQNSWLICLPFCAFQLEKTEGTAAFPTNTKCSGSLRTTQQDEEEQDSGCSHGTRERTHHHQHHHQTHGEHGTWRTELTSVHQESKPESRKHKMREKRTNSKHLSGQGALHICSHEDGWERQNAGQDNLLHRTSVVGLTHRFTHSHTIILRLKIVPVASAAAIYKAHALSLGEVEVPTGHHGPAGPRHRLLGADSCVEMGQNVNRTEVVAASNASQCYRPQGLDRARRKDWVTLNISEG